MTEPLVQFQDVWRTYTRDKNEVPVLQGLSVEIGKGEFHAFMGPSGSGKSTLLNLVAGLDQPTKGAVLVDGVQLTGFNEAELANWRGKHVGFIFQLFNLIAVLTAFENVELPLLLTSMKRKERRERVKRALSIVGLEDRVEHYPRQLSGGQEQRVAIARALVADPSLLLADEPTGDLDSDSAKEVLELLQELQREQGKTILMVTHDLRAAAAASRVHYLEKGTLQPQVPASYAAILAEARGEKAHAQGAGR